MFGQRRIVEAHPAAGLMAKTAHLRTSHHRTRARVESMNQPPFTIATALSDHEAGLTNTMCGARTLSLLDGASMATRAAVTNHRRPPPHHLISIPDEKTRVNALLARQGRIRYGCMLCVGLWLRCTFAGTLLVAIDNSPTR